MTQPIHSVGIKNNDSAHITRNIKISLLLVSVAFDLACRNMDICTVCYRAMLRRMRLCHSKSSVRDVEVCFSHRLAYFENNFTAE